MVHEGIVMIKISDVLSPNYKNVSGELLDSGDGF